MWVKTQTGEYLNIAGARTITVTPSDKPGQQQMVIRFPVEAGAVDGSRLPTELTLAVFKDASASVYHVVLEELLRGTASFVDLSGAPDKIEQRFWQATRQPGKGKLHEVH